MDRKILVYEPNPACERLFAYYIKKEDVRPILTRSKTEFLDLTKSQRFIAIFSDCRLLLEMAKSPSLGSYLVGTTADNRILTSNIKNDFELDELLLKPISREQYLRTLQNALASHRK